LNFPVSQSLVAIVKIGGDDRTIKNMKNNYFFRRKEGVMKRSSKLIMYSIALVSGLLMFLNTSAFAQAVPGGTLDPHTITKYVIPLVIPPVMNDNGTVDNYDIAVRQFQQQILPGGIWDTVADPCCRSGTRFNGPWGWCWGCTGSKLPVQLPILHD
jgi:hypothetical protein